MDNENLFWFVFIRRSIICFAIIILLFFTCVLRVIVTATKNYKTVQENQSSIRLTISKLRGTIYDCNMVPLTNNSTKIIAAVSPTPRAITAISSILKGDEKELVLKTLKSGKPALCELKEPIDCDGIVCFKVFTRSEKNNLAVHTVGYSNSDGVGVSGIEYYYNDILQSEENAEIVYYCDGLGRILEGIEPKTINNTSIIANGVVTTIDSKIQSICEENAKNIESGAIVVSEVTSGKIKAMVSMPTYNPLEVEKYLNLENSPLFNRATAAFNVGSVFKPCVAAAGLEENNKNFTYNCTGSCLIADRHFKCHNHLGHGEMNLKTALANSCNTYFYNYAFSLNADPIYKMASSLMFGKSITLCKNFKVSKGNLTSLNSLKNIAKLANFSIGQGELLLSPVSMLTLYTAIANGGSYRSPTIIEGTVSGGEIKREKTNNLTNVMSENTAKLLIENLKEVVENGTGKSAKPTTVSAAGKTATAQTGKFENSTEICSAWFCGFFPVENPQYVVIVFSENSLKQSKSCGEIFSNIADQIAAIS